MLYIKIFYIYISPLSLLFFFVRSPGLAIHKYFLEVDTQQRFRDFGKGLAERKESSLWAENCVALSSFYSFLLICHRMEFIFFLGKGTCVIKIKNYNRHYKWERDVCVCDVAGKIFWRNGKKNDKEMSFFFVSLVVAGSCELNKTNSLDCMTTPKKDERKWKTQNQPAC